MKKSLSSFIDNGNEPLDKPTRIYLALFKDYGEVTPETLRAMEQLLEEKRRS